MAGLRSVRCPICGDVETIPAGRHSDFVGVRIWACERCTHWFAHPEPDEASLARHYREVYAPRRQAWFSEEYFVLMERRAEAQATFIKRALRLAPGRRIAGLAGCAALDWGCGLGALVSQITRDGAFAVGYDTDETILGIGRKRYPNLTLCDTETLASREDRFDLLLLSHVVEHCRALTESAAKMLDLLRPGGVVFVEVPNSAAEMFHASLDCESHLHFFSGQSLMRLFSGLNVSTLACRDCGPSIPHAGVNMVAGSEMRLRYGRRATLLLRAAAGLARQGWLNSRRVCTPYDGFYKHYPGDGSGMWLRYLGQVATS